MALNTPFSYTDYLIGEEIIFRALSQQQIYAGEGKYGMTWDPADTTVLLDYQELYESERQYFTNLPSHCVPYPPCDWKKDEDSVRYDQFRDIILKAEANVTYRFNVYFRTDQGTVSFALGQQVISYTPDQNALDPAIQGQFDYLKREITPSGSGKAAIVIERLEGGVLNKTYYYLFDLEIQE